MTLQPPSLLIVDDDMLVVKKLEAYIRAEEPTVFLVSAFDITQALSAIRDNGPFDVVVTDLSLRTNGLDIDGLQVISAAQDKDDLTEIILITLFETTGERVADALDSGANQYLDKNLKNFDTILKTVVKRRLRSSFFHRRYVAAIENVEQNAGHQIAMDNLKEAAHLMKASLQHIHSIRADQEAELRQHEAALKKVAQTAEEIEAALSNLDEFLADNR